MIAHQSESAQSNHCTGPSYSVKSNDYLSLKFGKGNDYWFHVKGNSGSHVVIKGPEGEEKPPKEIISAAASLAAYYSKEKNGKKVSVIYTQCKYVKKSRSDNPGTVNVTKENSISVAPKSIDDLSADSDT